MKYRGSWHKLSTGRQTRIALGEVTSCDPLCCGLVPSGFLLLLASEAVAVVTSTEYSMEYSMDFSA